MFSRALLLRGAGVRQTIGVAGQQGFGVGVYGGSSSDLEAIGLSVMSGTGNPASDNYGNYKHSNGSIMCFIPAFCYRIGNPAAPSHSRDGGNALEIRDASLGEGDGWILHRAFIDGGERKSGFFCDKYLCSGTRQGVSVKDANQLSLAKSYESTRYAASGCTGCISDAIIIGRARGEAYACVSAFQWSALAMLSLAHGQASSSSENCDWYDGSLKSNFPKGCNSGDRKDYNDSSVSFSPHSSFADFGKTGSGVPFGKTTHNGQSCGVADMNGCMYQPLLGACGGTSGGFYVAKESVKMHDFTESTCGSSSMYDAGSGITINCTWGSQCSSLGSVFPTNSSGVMRAVCGIFPVGGYFNNDSTDLFGYDYARTAGDLSQAICGGGYYNDGANAGVWCRGQNKWTNENSFYGFRIAGYAK